MGLEWCHELQRRKQGSAILSDHGIPHKGIDSISSLWFQAHVLESMNITQSFQIKDVDMNVTSKQFPEKYVCEVMGFPVFITGCFIGLHELRCPVTVGGDLRGGVF